MPWHVSKTSQCPVSKPWGVILDASGKVIKGGCHESKDKADAHMAALYANEPSAMAELIASAIRNAIAQVARRFLPR